MKILIKNGRLIDPASNLDRVGDRKGHMAGCYIVAGVGLLASALVR